MTPYECPECWKFVEDRPQAREYWAWNDAFGWLKGGRTMCNDCWDDKNGRLKAFWSYTNTIKTSDSGLTITSSPAEVSTSG